MISIHAPSRERHSKLLRYKRWFKISIHAPSRERLCHSAHHAADCMISIHAPSRERLDLAAHCCCEKLFQSTLPRGSDCSCYPGGRRTFYFNPRSLAGATFKKRQNFLPLPFQSTLPRGSDYESCRSASTRVNFNPRSLAGATLFVDEQYKMRMISIHAPSRERRLYYVSFRLSILISIHAPSRERPFQPALDFCFLRFQSTLPRGSDFTI